MARGPELTEILEETGALMYGHFRLTSGRHAEAFLLSSLLTQFPEKCAQAAAMLADPFRDQHVETVVGTAFGGLLLGYEVARGLSARFVFAEKAEGAMQLRRGFQLGEGERVLIVEDVVTTGGSVFKAMAAIAEYAPEVVGVAALWDRSAGEVQFGAPLWAPISRPLPSHPEDACPLCRAGQPVIEPKARRN